MTTMTKPIGPGEFADRMAEIGGSPRATDDKGRDKMTQAVDLMLETLSSNGYGFGVDVFNAMTGRIYR